MSSGPDDQLRMSQASNMNFEYTRKQVTSEGSTARIPKEPGASQKSRAHPQSAARLPKEPGASQQR